MNLIKDIRLFESDITNIDGNAMPQDIGKLYHYDHMQCLDVIQQLLFLLRHREFGFDGFDHLYVNFTPCIPHGTVQDAKRRTIREFSWHHYVDIGCDAGLFNSWTLEEQTHFILDATKKAAILKAPDTLRKVFADSFEEVIQQGTNLLLPYKKKESPDFTVEIFVRINEEPDFFPLIRITGKDGTVKAEQALRSYGRDEFISQIGTITIGKTYIKIAPRKNWYADFYGLKPVRISF